MAAGTHSASKDLETFYLLLWLHGGGGQEDKIDDSERLKLNIPHTVFIKYGSPSVWYFTGKTGSILKKSESNLTFANILREFSAVKTKNKEVSANLYSFDQDDKSKIEYLSWEDLEQICSDPELHRKKERFPYKFCVLQSHIEGGTLYNSVLECVWTQNFILLKQIRNIVPIVSQKHNITDRLMTFDGPEHCVQIEKVRDSQTVKSAKEMMTAIVSHLSRQTHESITTDKLLLYFKRCNSGKVNLVWLGELVKKGTKDKSTMLNFFKTAGSLLHKPFELEPLRRNQDIITRFDSKLNVMKLHRPDFDCLMCLERTPSCRFVKVANSFIIKLYVENRSKYRALVLKGKNNMTQETPFQLERDIIPNYFRNLLESISAGSYQSLASSAAFLKEENLICVECFLLGASRTDNSHQAVIRDSIAMSTPRPVRVLRNQRVFLNPRCSRKPPQVQDESTNKESKDLTTSRARLPNLTLPVSLAPTSTDKSVRASLNPSQLYKLVQGRVQGNALISQPPVKYKLGSLSSRTTRASQWSSNLVSADDTIDKLYLGQQG